MFRRRPRSKTSFLVRRSDRGSDIVKPDNTSLIVNESDTETDALPKELTSVLSEDEDDHMGDSSRKSTSFIKSLTQKSQSTPKNKSSNPNGILKEIDSSVSPNFNRNKSKVLQSSLKCNRIGSQVETKKVSYFEEIIKACGASPLQENSSYVMSEDQAVFSVKVNNKLKDNNDNIQQFFESIEKEMENPEQLQKMLSHTLTAEDCEIARGPVQEPLIRMLLNADCLQAGLLEILLKKLSSIIIDNEAENEDSQIALLILRQFRFLNRMKDVKIINKLFEIIHVASVKVQREIIFLLPEIVTEEEAIETSTQLVDMLKCNVMLTPVIIDTITNLPLKKIAQSEVRTKMLSRLDKSPSEFLPSLVQFVLNRCDAEELDEVINGLRENLPFNEQHLQIRKSQIGSKSDKDNKNSAEDSYLKLTFENLKFSVMTSKHITDAWIKVISGINSSAEFRCLDLTMLIIFYSCLFGRKNQIILLIRNKIKSGVLTEVHVQIMFNVLLVITVEYFSPILELASILLKSFEQKISDFGAVLYKESFVHFHFYLEQSVITEILLHIGTGSPAVINTALHILKILSENEKESLSRHTVSIMGLLIKVPDLDSTQVRLLMDIIAELVFSKSAENNVGWQDELQIFIRKQLTSSKLEQCKKGIMAAIMFGRHAAKGEEYETNDTQINSLLEMALGSNGTCETKRAFFNDEFATMIRESQLNKSFLETWNDKVYRMVMDNLFVRNIEVECEHFPMFLQYSLGDDRKVVFPVVYFIISSDSNKPLNIPVSVIPSALRLLWCCEQNFKRISPVFCASVIMPEISVFDNFNTFDTTQKKLIMDCLFLCANYLIESINAFCKEKITDKALLRVKQLISVRKLIVGHVHLLSNYVPPFCQFYAPVQKPAVKKKTTDKKPKKGRKRKLEDAAAVAAETSNSAIEEIPIPGTSTSCSIEANDVKERNIEETDLHTYRGYFRELHFFAYQLLKIELKLNPTKTFKMNESLLNKECWTYGPLEKPELQASDIVFLLEDYTSKSEQILKETKRIFNFKNKPTASAIEHMTPEHFIRESVKILPELLDKIEILSSYCKDLLKANDGIYDAQGMYPQDAADIKLALAAALKFVAEIISWQGFQNPTNKILFRDVISILSRKKISREDNLSAASIKKTALNAATYLEEFVESVLVLSGAISIVKAFQACFQYSSSTESSSALADLCHGLLCRPWFTVTGVLEKGAVYNQQVDFLLKTYFANVDNKLEVVRNTSKIALSEVDDLKGNDSTMKTIKTVNKRNFPLLYRTLCEALVSASTAEISKIKDDDQLSLEIWNTIVETLLVLVEIVKIHSSRINLASLLKRSQSMIQLFLSKGMPVMESALRVNSIEVLKLLKSLQTVTRFLHSVCCHSKITSDSIVAAHVPTIRSQCERLTLEVKGMLILNKIPMECITIAILKNRDLKGNDIISQETVEDDNSDDDSALPPEDTPDDDYEENKDAKIGETQESNSEIY